MHHVQIKLHNGYAQQRIMQVNEDCCYFSDPVEIDIEMTPRPGFDPVTHTYSRVVVIPVGNVPSIQTREESGS